VDPTKLVGFASYERDSSQYTVVGWLLDGDEHNTTVLVVACQAKSWAVLSFDSLEKVEHWTANSKDNTNFNCLAPVLVSVMSSMKGSRIVNLGEIHNGVFAVKCPGEIGGKLPSGGIMSLREDQIMVCDIYSGVAFPIRAHASPVHDSYVNQKFGASGSRLDVLTASIQRLVETSS